VIDRTGTRRMRSLLVLSAFILGACGLVYEYVLSVLGNHLIGSSTEEIFIVIGIMMFAMGLGAALQQKMSGALFQRFLLLEIALGFVGGFSATVIYMTFIHTESHRVVLYAFSLAIGILIGMEIPIIIRINESYGLDLKTNLSAILSMDYVGALVGALLFTYILLVSLPLARIGFILGVVNTTIALAGLALLAREVRYPLLVGAAGLTVMAAMIYGFARSEDWTRYGEQKYYRDPIVSSVTTSYQHLVLTKRGERLNLYINGHLQFSSRDEHIYHELLVHPAMHLALRQERVLILGGGDGLALREVLKYPEVKSVSLVDIDREVIRLATDNQDLVRLNRGAFHDARVHLVESNAVRPGESLEVLQSSQRRSEMFSGKLHHLAEVHVFVMDADRFVRDTEGFFDAIIVDLPDPDQLELAKLYSVDFYAALRERLAPAGIIATQSTSPFHARQAFLCIGKTIEAAGLISIPYHENVPSFGEWGWHLSWKAKAAPLAMKDRLRAVRELDVPTRFLTPELLHASLEFGRGWLEGQDQLLESTLMNPVIVGYFRDAWKGD